MKAISPEEWKGMWAATGPETVGKSMSLSQYAELCNEVKAEWRRRYPRFDFSNGRYEVHLEQALRLSAEVPDEYVATVTDDDLQYDRFCFPLLNARREALSRKARKP